jgi:Spx/MgsR family transcriptional regulator
MLTLYGIKNCDSCKKARAWLTQHKIEFRFHDFRDDGLTEAQLMQFIDHADWETLLNKASASWRQLSPQQQNDLTQTKAVELMLKLPTLIKRPVLDSNNGLLVGFKPEMYAEKFK